MTVVGFDFGTTNSLISIVVGGRALNALDVDGLPIPSVVAYEGGSVIVGKEAKAKLDGAGLGIHGRIVRSPKFLLGDDTVHVGGVARSTTDIVSDVVAHVRRVALSSAVGRDLGGASMAVVTIPVDFDGRRRRALRDAFARSGMTVVHFVHEPFAALYGYLRSGDDTAGEVRRLSRQQVLVVDWGGGTLDLTLCSIGDTHITQVKNDGTDEVGGDAFDETVRNHVISEALRRRLDTESPTVGEDARIRLLRQCEDAKIDLSTRDRVELYIPSFFDSVDDDDLDHSLTRSDLERVTDPLIRKGMERIRSVLDAARVGPNQVAMVLATGGMSQMPAIRSRLHELFGPDRVMADSRTATLIAEGAAWMAHDNSRLHLAKAVEVEVARRSFLPVVPRGTEMPGHDAAFRREVHLYCADPRDGVAKFPFRTPVSVRPDVQVTEPRLPLADAVVKVDPRAQPFRERLELEVTIDHDLVFHARARSLNRKDQVDVEIHDLEFGVRLPLAVDGGDDLTAPFEDWIPPDVDAPVHGAGDLAIRANLATTKDDTLIPGELMYTIKPSYFEVALRPPQVQVEERLYYEPCAVCRRASNDPACRCSTDPQPAPTPTGRH